MNKKLTSLIVGAMTSLAIAALPAGASAGEFPIHCETATCISSINGGHAELRTTGSAIGITCTSSTGSTSQANNTTTGTVQITFHGCKDTFVGGGCTTAGQPAGTIKTNSLVSHMIYIDPNKTTPGVLLTGMNVTIGCPFGIIKTVTGNVIGHWNAPSCGVTQSSHAISFAVASAGHQKVMKMTTVGTAFDLVMSDEVNPYETASMAMSATFTHQTKTALTC